MKSKGVAVLLAFFLGGLGIHRFYLGNWLWGLLYLLFSWTLVPLFVSLLEFLYLLFMPSQAFHQRYSGSQPAQPSPDSGRRPFSPFTRFMIGVFVVFWAVMLTSLAAYFCYHMIWKPML